MKDLIKCPECDGYGSEQDIVDVTDYYPCSVCNGEGLVEKGTKTWLEKLFESE